MTNGETEMLFYDHRSHQQTEQTLISMPRETGRGGGSGRERGRERERERERGAGGGDRVLRPQRLQSLVRCNPELLPPRHGYLGKRSSAGRFQRNPGK